MGQPGGKGTGQVVAVTKVPDMTRMAVEGRKEKQNRVMYVKEGLVREGFLEEVTPELGRDLHIDILLITTY